MYTIYSAIYFPYLKILNVCLLTFLYFIICEHISRMMYSDPGKDLEDGAVYKWHF